MTLRLRLILGLLGTAVPVLAMAAPQNVSGITAVNESGKVRVTWTQLSDPDITSYRIFYSHTSILQNGGLYDDFESTDGSVNNHLIQSIPPVDELYVSVLAVNSKGEESPYFFEEAHVMLTDNAGQTDEFRLLNAEAISATGVTLHFSHPVSIPQDRALEAIMIENGSGVKLPMRRYVIEGSTVTVHTAVQERSVVYRIALGQVITGKGANNATIMLSADQTPILFMGHISGVAPTSGTVNPTPTTPGVVMDVTQLRLSAQPDSATTYAVEATWQAPAGVQVAGYSVSQSIDGGRTFSTPQMIAHTAGTVKIPGVPPGTYGVLVKVLSTDNNVSRGIMQVINLPGTPATNTQGNVTQQPKPTGSTSLPSSGPALWLVVAGLGALTGAWNLRARREQTV